MGEDKSWFLRTAKKFGTSSKPAEVCVLDTYSGMWVNITGWYAFNGDITE
jgi:hypothetical protein